MKNIIKILFLAVVVCSCSSNDDRNTEPIAESCFNLSLGISAEYINPFPDHVPVNNFYMDWMWTMKNETTLCISFNEMVLNGTNSHGEGYRYYYYYSLNKDNNCATLVDVRVAMIGPNIFVDENGLEFLMSWSLFENITSSELQEFNLNDKIVGKNIITADNGNQETYQFWIELTEENHFEFNQLELNSGL